MLKSSSLVTTNMSTIRTIKKPNESYFKKITLFEFEIGGEVVNVNLVEDSNEAYIKYWDFKFNQWTEDAPQVVNDLGRDMDGLPYLESWLHNEGPYIIEENETIDVKQWGKDWEEGQL